jgi:hypothetical protein
LVLSNTLLNFGIVITVSFKTLQRGQVLVSSVFLLLTRNNNSNKSRRMSR